MTLLLDTVAAIWWLTDDQQLGERTLRDIENPLHPVYASDIVVLEWVIKASIGKLKLAINFDQLDQRLAADNIKQIPFDGWAAQQFLGITDLVWADPFDRAHMAMALAKRMTLVTSDHNILTSGIQGLKLMDARR